MCLCLIWLNTVSYVIFSFFITVSDIAILIRPPCGNHTLQDIDAIYVKQHCHLNLAPLFTFHWFFFHTVLSAMWSPLWCAALWCTKWDNALKLKNSLWKIWFSAKLVSLSLLLHSYTNSCLGLFRNRNNDRGRENWKANKECT